MAQATEAQVKALETALIEQFFNLVQGARFRINLARMADPNKPLDQYEPFTSYNDVYLPLVQNWLKMEYQYEKTSFDNNGVKGIILSGQLQPEDFFYSSSLPKLDALVAKFDAEKTTNGIGFIPLLIWAVIAIIGFFTAEHIADDLTSATKDKTALLDKTAQTCKDLNLTATQCNAMISQTQAEASTSGDSIFTYLKWGIGIFAAYKLAEVTGILKPKTT